MISIGSELAAACFSAAVAIILLCIAIRKGFFVGWKGVQDPVFPPTFLLVVGAFLVYFSVSLFTPPIYTKLLVQTTNSSIELATWVNCMTAGVTFCMLALYARIIYRPITRAMWRSTKCRTVQSDATVAFLACLISFPLVVCTGQLLEILVYLIFHTLQLPDQLVILFLKTTFGKPLYFFLATFSIIIFAPAIEELLFRGFLQTYLRRYFNAPIAILLSSATFSLFHYSHDQGLGNIPIIGSLFVLANFLGFVYERQGSLLSPMILHATFNALSIANLYFLGT
jgi:uncharacterized protein